jgi:hypothetical protein
MAWFFFSFSKTNSPLLIWQPQVGQILSLPLEHDRYSARLRERTSSLCRCDYSRETSGSRQLLSWLQQTRPGSLTRCLYRVRTPWNHPYSHPLQHTVHATINASVRCRVRHFHVVPCIIALGALQLLFGWNGDLDPCDSAIDPRYPVRALGIWTGLSCLSRRHS